MNTRFHCPHMNRIISSEECWNSEETPCCESCTSEIDTNRKELCEWLIASYGDRYQISMKPDGIEIIVHDQLRVIADPGDEYEGTYLGVECGEYGSTHTHPQDMQRDVAALLDGKRAIGLSGEGGPSCFSWRELFMREPEQIAEWQMIVDAEGAYTPEEYAAKIGVKLLRKELRFHCPAEEREITERACVARCMRRDRGAVCKACKGETMSQAAAAWIAEALLPHCGGVKLRRKNDKATLYLIVHEGLSIELLADGLEGDGYMGIRLGGQMFTHCHPTGREMLEMLVPFLKGRDVLVCTSSLGCTSCGFVTAEELRRNWKKITRGLRVWIADLQGVWEKKDYKGRLFAKVSGAD